MTRQSARVIMRRIRPAVWAGLLLSLLGIGAAGGWMAEWVTGHTRTVVVDHCYMYYGRQDDQHFRCEGYWQDRRSDNPYAPYEFGVRGPVVGVPIPRDTPLFDPQSSQEFGYQLAPGAYETRYFAILNGDAAIVVPKSHLILGPTAVGVFVTCAVLLIAMNLFSPAASDVPRSKPTTAGL